MNWQTLLDEGRWHPDAPESAWKDYDLSAFEKDYKMVVASAGFRRLQDKTQVFPLDTSDFVRTRLTHSLEVSMVAKQLGTMVCRYIAKPEHKLSDQYGFRQDTPQRVEEVLLCAGLLHDLGNPPFGHFGETVIGDWFRTQFEQDSFQYEGKPVRDVLTEQMRGDLEHFEGNAQSFRLLMKAKHESAGSDLNLTHAVSHTLMKYPASSTSFDKGDRDIKRHKNGYFLAEAEELYEIAGKLGTLGEDGVLRHPLTYLLEAADDIAYATADLEDAFKKGLFTLDEFVDFFDREVERLAQAAEVKIEPQTRNLIAPLRREREAKARTKEGDAAQFNKWVKEARGWLMYCAAYGFTRNYRSIMEGGYPCDLFSGTFHELSIQALKNAMGKFAYHTHGIVKLELSAQAILGFLLDRFVPAAMHYEQKAITPAERKYIDLISENYIEDYHKCGAGRSPQDRLYLRLLMATDYISGMTDSFAKNLYQELTGIR